MTDTRASMCAAVWDVLALALRHSYDKDENLPRCLRPSCQEEHMKRMLQLDLSLVLPHSRELKPRATDSPFHMVDDSFFPFERTLW